VERRPDTLFAWSGDLTIAYQVVGEGPIDVVFVPGFMSHVELNWDYVFVGAFLERLAEVSRLVVLDKRGSGLSDRSLGAGTLEDRMNDVLAVMDAEGLQRAAVIGVSNGGPLAALVAATHPERVSSLVLLISGCPGSEPPDPALEDVLTLVREFWTTGLVLNTIVQHPPDPDEAVAQLARFERYCSTPSVAVELMRRNAESDLTPFLGLIRAPTLVINGRDDPIVPLRQGTYLAEHIPGARQVVVEADHHASWRITDYDEPLRHILAFLTGERPSAAARVDRVLSTVVFTDIVRSTTTAADLGDANWHSVIDRYDEVCDREVTRHRGVLVKHTGDGMLAHFDGPGRATSCALSINEQVGSLGLRTRSGVHTGEVELRGADLGGLAVHIASRVMSAAGAGEVLVSRTVKDLTIGADLEFVDRGEHTLKGVPGSWPLYAVR
jgi:pimeloyl-ACP methyl ester carboxylesterase